MIELEYDFTLPRGFVTEDGALCRNGKMRLATAADEILPLRDPRVLANPDSLIVVILSRVITKLGALDGITPAQAERLFVADLAYLQDLYNRINQADAPVYEGVCPHCGEPLKIPVNFQRAGRS